MPTCSKCDKFLKKGYTKIKTQKFGLNLKMNWTAGGIPPPNTWYDEISYECKGGCDNGAGGVWTDEPEEEEQPSSPDDGCTALTCSQQGAAICASCLEEEEEQPSSPDDGTAENEEPQVEYNYEDQFTYQLEPDFNGKVARFIIITNVMDYLKKMIVNPDITKYHIEAIDLCSKALMELKPK